MFRSTFSAILCAVLLLLVMASDSWAFRGCRGAARRSQGCGIGLFRGRLASHTPGTAAQTQPSVSSPLPPSAAGGCSNGSCGVGRLRRR